MYNATTDSIDTPEFSKLTTILDFQKEHDDQDMDWLLNKIKTFVERNDKNKSEQNNKGVAFGVTTTSPTTTNVEELLTNEAQCVTNIAAITSRADCTQGPQEGQEDVDISYTDKKVRPQWTSSVPVQVLPRRRTPLGA